MVAMRANKMNVKFEETFLKSPLGRNQGVSPRTPSATIMGAM